MQEVVNLVNLTTLWSSTQSVFLVTGENWNRNLYAADHNPIQNQQIYLDKARRKRLLDEYKVKAYPIVQCEGESVFIPARAPHQVHVLCIIVFRDWLIHKFDSTDLTI